MPSNPDGSAQNKEYLSCYKWMRNPESHTGPATDYWNTYPGAAENYDTHEVTILFWEAKE